MCCARMKAFVQIYSSRKFKINKKRVFFSTNAICPELASTISTTNTMPLPGQQIFWKDHTPAGGRVGLDASAGLNAVPDSQGS